MKILELQCSECGKLLPMNDVVRLVDGVRVIVKIHPHECLPPTTAEAAAEAALEETP
jgi:hypothetical protein